MYTDKINQLVSQLKAHFADKLQAVTIALNEVTIEVLAQDIHAVCYPLRDEQDFQFDTLIDLCGVDYLEYGLVQWTTDQATSSGYSRAVEHGSDKERICQWNKPRFAVVYHLLSTRLNQRLRIRVFCEDDAPKVDSVIDIWNAATWFEREAYEFFGILFQGHPDLRRLLTDYGFIGHPFRKDFPLIGQVAMRYDAKLGRVVYEPVDIEPRVLVPKVGRSDNRYESVDNELDQ